MSQRNRLLVDPPVQWAIAQRILIHWGLLILCMFMIGTFVRLMFSTGSTPFSDALVDAIKSQAPLFTVMFMLVPVFVRDTLKLSNRFAGPMFRLKTAFRTMAEGNQGKPVRFRDGDFWTDAADDFNKIVADLNSLRDKNAELEQEVAVLKAQTASKETV